MPGERPDAAAAPNDIPDQAYEWDRTAMGSRTIIYSTESVRAGGLVVCGVPVDVTRRQSSASWWPTRSAQSTTRIYQARFDSADWSGQLLSFPVSIATGGLLTPESDAAVVIAGQDFNAGAGTPPGRNWITWNPSTGDGVALLWANLTTGAGGRQE